FACVLFSLGVAVLLLNSVWQHLVVSRKFIRNALSRRLTPVLKLLKPTSTAVNQSNQSRWEQTKAKEENHLVGIIAIASLLFVFSLVFFVWSTNFLPEMNFIAKLNFPFGTNVLQKMNFLRKINNPSGLMFAQRVVFPISGVS